MTGIVNDDCEVASVDKLFGLVSEKDQAAGKLATLKKSDGRIAIIIQAHFITAIVRSG